MRLSRRWWLAAVGTPALAGALWYAAELVYLREHRAISAERARLESRAAAFDEAAAGTRDARLALRDLAATMLGPDREIVEHRLRGLLSDLAAGAGLTEVVVSHGRPSWSTSPAAERGSGVHRDLRQLVSERPDFAIVGARVQGLGSLEQGLRLLSGARAQPWVHRVEGFSISPQGREAIVYEVKVDVATIFAPDLAPAGASTPALVAVSEADASVVARLVSRDPFVLDEPVTVVEAPPPPPPPVEAPESAPADPLKWWRVVGVLEVESAGGGVVEVMLVRTDSGQGLTLRPGDEIAGARLEVATGESAVFRVGETLIEVRTGQTLAEGRPAESVHSATTSKPS